MMNYLIAAAIGILSLSLCFVLAPVVGGQFEAATPALPATSGWNQSYNQDLKSGSDVFETLAPFLIIVGLVFLAGLVLLALRMVS